MQPKPAPLLIALFLAIALTACQSTAPAAPDVSGTWSQQSASIASGCSDSTALVAVQLMIQQEGTDLEGTLVLDTGTGTASNLSFEGQVGATGAIRGTATYSNASATPPYSELVPVKLTLDAGQLQGTLLLSDQSCAEPMQILVTLEQA